MEAALPIPKPRLSGDKPETEQEFVSRCMGDPTMNTDYPKQPQRAAVCYSTYRDAKKPKPAAVAPGKAVAPATCDPPAPDESVADFMQRCMDGGDTQAACMMAWNAEKALPAAVERGVQMKWLATTLEIKDVDQGQRMISGIATTPSVDLVGDVVESMGARYKEPPNIPLLLHHDHRLPVGTIQRLDKSEKGLLFTAKIAKVDSPPALRDRCEEAYSSLRAGLIRGVSIGFTPVPGQTEHIKGGQGLRFKEYFLHEISLVCVPANQDASVTIIRSLDERARGLLERPATPMPPASFGQYRPHIQGAPRQDAVVEWINDVANKKEWARTLEERKGQRAWNDAMLSKHAAANIRLRQPTGDITQEQIQFEAWELSRFW